MRAVIAVILLASGVLPASLSGQSGAPGGIVLGVALNASTQWLSSGEAADPGRETGVGGGFRVGIRIFDFASIFFAVDGARMDLPGGEGRHQLIHTDMGVRIHLRRSPMATWLEIARNTRQGAVQTSFGRKTLRGTGLSLALGAGRTIAPGLDLELGLHLVEGDFDEPDPPEAEPLPGYSGPSARLRLGFNWWP